MPDHPRARLPWLLVAASVLLLVLLLYVMFASYIPGRRRIADLEIELKEVYARETALQTRLAQQDQRSARRDQQIHALRAERDGLARRIEDLEKQLSAARAAKRR